MASTRQTASLLRCAATLECPTRAAERAPKGPQIADRQTCRSGGRMIVAMDAAMVYAAAGRGKRLPHRSLSGNVAVAPSGVAAEAPNRRPVGHGRWWCRLVESGEIASAVDHLAADNSQVGGNFGDLIL